MIVKERLRDAAAPFFSAKSQNLMTSDMLHIV